MINLSCESDNNSRAANGLLEIKVVTIVTFQDLDALDTPNTGEAFLWYTVVDLITRSNLLGVLFPTLLHNNGFELEDFGGSGKFCQKENINRNYIGSENNLDGVLDHGTMRYRPHLIYLGLRKNKLYHPIKPAKDTVKYYLKRFNRLLKRKIRRF